MFRPISSLFIYIIVLSIRLSAASADDKFSFDYDFCFFRNDDSKIFVEFYYSFYQNQLRFLKTGTGFEADGLIELDIVDKSINMPVVQKDFKVPLIISDTAGYNRNLKLTGQINLLLDSGSYTFLIKAADYNDTLNYVNYQRDVDVPGFENNAVDLSTVQFAADIRRSSDSKSIFYKNTLEVIPNPSKLFGNNLPDLYYYVELYNLNKQVSRGEYLVNTVITDLNGNMLKSESKKFKVKNESRVEYGSVNISDLKTNIYKFFVKLTDAGNKPVAETENQFLIFNSDTSSVSLADPSDRDYLASEYVKIPEDVLDQEFEYAGYLMSDLFKKQYSNLTDPDAKRKFMFAFWRNLDPERLTPLNEFKRDYFERVGYANKNFAGNFVEGWKTDRGRVYCIYGKADDVERFPFEPSTRAYEIWKYDKVQGGVIFVFVDLSNESGNYVLVHSTARTELRDDDWRRRLDVRR